MNTRWTVDPSRLNLSMGSSGLEKNPQQLVMLQTYFRPQVNTRVSLTILGTQAIHNNV